jgi:hypothetical protein
MLLRRDRAFARPGRETFGPTAPAARGATVCAMDARRRVWALVLVGILGVASACGDDGGSSDQGDQGLQECLEAAGFEVESSEEPPLIAGVEGVALTSPSGGTLVLFAFDSPASAESEEQFFTEQGFTVVTVGSVLVMRDRELPAEDEAAFEDCAA